MPVLNNRSDCTFDGSQGAELRQERVCRMREGGPEDRVGMFALVAGKEVPQAGEMPGQPAGETPYLHADGIKK